MATIINNPTSDSSGMGGLLLGAILVAIIAGGLFLVYGPPFNRQAEQGNSITIPDEVNIDVTTPAPTTPAQP